MNTKETNDLTSSILSSIDLIAKAMNTTGSLVVEARIKEIVDEGLGVYKVQYLENTFEAYAPGQSIVYSIDDVVYIIVPNGNFDENKIILSHANPNKTVYATLENEDIYIPLGDNLLTEAGSVDLCSYKTQTKSISSDYLYNLLLLMNDSLQDSRVFDLSCEIKTAIPQDQRTNGNYGLVLTLPVVQDDISTTYAITLDISTLTGDPYDYQVYSTQDRKFELPENMELDLGGIPTLTAFVKDFIGQDNTKPDDIFIRNIQVIPMLNKTEVNMDGYYLYINASGGRSFYNGHYGNKTLSPTLYYKGKVTRVQNYQCYWFKENALIGFSHEKFTNIGGVGWEILNEVNKTTLDNGGNSGVQYVTNNYEYVVEGSSFLTNTKYKCVLVKNGQTVQNTATIRIIGSPVELELISDKKDNVCIDKVGTVKLTMIYKDSRVSSEDIITYAYWKRFDKYGNYVEDSSLIDPRLLTLISRENGINIYESNIEFPVSVIDSANTIYCSISNVINNREVLVGTRSILLTTVASASYSIMISGGDKLYKYDADGDSPLVSNYDGPLSSANPTIVPLSIKIYKPTGEEFTEEEYSVSTVEWLVPIEKKSMITIDNSYRGDTTSNPGYYTIRGSYDSLSNLSYSIRNTYDRSRSDNTIIARAYFKKNSAEMTTNINFLKDGESGTNGTKYSAIVVYVENPTSGEAYAYEEKDTNGVENKLQLIYTRDIDQWYRFNPAKGVLIPITYGNKIADFAVKFYTDGVLDQNRDEEWSIFDNTVNYGNMGSPVYVDKSDHNYIKLSSDGKWVDPSYVYAIVLQVKVTKNDDKGSSLTNSKESVYAYYPIEATYVEKYDYLKDMLPMMRGGYSQVLYATDGTNPKFDASNPFEIDSLIDDVDISDLYNYRWNVSENLVLGEDDESDNICSNIKPKTKYDNAFAKNYVEVGVFPSSSASTTLAGKIDYYTRELERSNTTLAYYDRIKNAAKVLNTFDYDTLDSTVKELQDFFAKKTEIIETVNTMYNQLYELKKYVAENKSEYTDLETLYSSIITMMDNVETLNENCGNLGKTTSALDFVQHIILNDYKLATLSNPNNISVYGVINNSINNYNDTVEIVLGAKQSQIDANFATAAATFKSQVYDILCAFVDDNRWDILINAYPVIEI